MIYAKVLLPPLRQEELEVVNDYIDYLENECDAVEWIPNKTLIKYKTEDQEVGSDVMSYTMAAFETVRINVYNKEAKTETIIQIQGGEVEGKFLIPLFPEDYKF